MSTAPGCHVGGLSWPRVEACFAAGWPALLPVGAGAKQHGRHLPMDADRRVAGAVAQALAAARPALIFPALAYGPYQAFDAFPGGASIAPETFRDLARQVVAGLLAGGAPAVLVLNTGYSTIAPLAEALAGQARAAACHLYRGERYLAAEAALLAQPRGGHGDEAETSLLLAIAPDAVALDEARPWLPERFEPPWSRDPAAPGYSPDGILGDPTRATAEKGRALLAAMVADVTAALLAVGPPA